MEHQVDMYISPLRRLLEAMGAKLQIVASFAGERRLLQPVRARARGRDVGQVICPLESGGCVRAVALGEG